MLRKFLIAVSLSVVAIALTASAHVPTQNTQQPDQQQQQQKAQSVTGKVTQVETGGKAFSMDVNQGGAKKTMRFVVDKNTTVQGHVGAGSTASVQYEPDQSGTLVALSVTEQPPQNHARPGYHMSVPLWFASLLPRYPVLFSSPVPPS
jgi:hypothetical protein